MRAHHLQSAERLPAHGHVQSARQLQPEHNDDVNGAVLYRVLGEFILILISRDAARVVVHDLRRGQGLTVEGHFAAAIADWCAAKSTGKRADTAGDKLRRVLQFTGREKAPLVARVLDGEMASVDLAHVFTRDRLATCFVELTARCNERCRHCYANSSPDVDTALPGEVLAQVVRDAAALGFRQIQFTGGDPLISPDLLPLARLAASLDFAGIEIYTNALALTDRLLGPLLECGATFAVSFYSHDAAHHDAITGVKGSHARTTANVRRAVAAGAAVRLAIVIMEENRDDLAATLAFCRDELGVPRERIGVDVMHAIGRGQTVAGLDAFSIAAAIGGVGGIHTGDAKAAPDAGPAAASEAASRGMWDGKICVAPTGEVFPCIFTRFVRLGTVPARSLREIVREPRPEVSAETQSHIAGMDLPALCNYLGERLQCLDCRTSAAAWLVAAGN